MICNLFPQMSLKSHKVKRNAAIYNKTSAKKCQPEKLPQLEARKNPRIQTVSRMFKCGPAGSHRGVKCILYV